MVEASIACPVGHESNETSYDAGPHVNRNRDLHRAYQYKLVDGSVSQEHQMLTKFASAAVSKPRFWTIVGSVRENA